MKSLTLIALLAAIVSTAILAQNPVITHKYTADPAAVVYNDTVYLYVGHDEALPDQNHYVLNEWLIFSSTDMVNWKEEGAFPASAFEWADGQAWASHVVERDGKFYWYVTVEHGTIPGKSMGVAVSDSPTGPFKDAIGAALVTNDMTTEHSSSYWDDIDPAVYIDNNGEAYIFWGNVVCYYAKLKDNLIELDGPIQTIDLPYFTEAPYIHKKGDWYYLTYAYQFPEKTAYAMSKSLTGPWEFKDILNEVAGNSNTNHQSIIEYKGKDYFIYHNGSLPTAGSSYRRSVCVDYLHYNEDGTLKRVIMTSEGVQPAE
ncbi:glycoside hydrolase family 43 protein [Geofilum rubicundum]|uniref:Glycoside hydrolase n=1 Tax=Geofilum rubicundum JCM 15548 TaxID=1236989 RepID=A0A0E9LW54_9BACT|nr:glycoside hydrolase family 43 protein [Geofilum rubicundum]GAO29533.1 glycoside hydrolase [Geofilum rubicundum JCM 15548]